MLVCWLREFFFHPKNQIKRSNVLNEIIKRRRKKQDNFKNKKLKDIGKKKQRTKENYKF